MCTAPATPAGTASWRRHPRAARTDGLRHHLRRRTTAGRRVGEKLYLKPGTHCIPLGDGDPESFMVGGCSLPTALHAIERAQITIGDTVLVLGAGPWVCRLSILARAVGAARVLCIGAPDAGSRAARTVGAHDTAELRRIGQEERIEWVRQRTDGRGADITIEAAGAPSAVVRCVAVHARCRARRRYRRPVHGSRRSRLQPARGSEPEASRRCAAAGAPTSRTSTAPCRSPKTRGLSAPWARLQLERYGLANAEEALRKVSGRESSSRRSSIPL